MEYFNISRKNTSKNQVKYQHSVQSTKLVANEIQQ